MATNITRKPSKTECNWYGPVQIIGTTRHDLVYTIKDLVSDRILDVHTSRLQYYDDSSLNVTSALLENIALTGNIYVPARIADIRINPSTRQTDLLVEWYGFETADATWEPFSTISQDVPKLVQEFLSTRSDEPSASLLKSF